MESNITLKDVRRIVAEQVLKMPWVRNAIISPVNEDIQVHAVGAGYVATIQVLGIGKSDDGYAVRVRDNESVSFFIFEADKIEATYEVHVKPLLIRKYFIATAKHIIRLATTAFEEHGKDARWVEGTIREGSFEVGRYLNFGGNSILFSYPRTDEVQTFTHNLNLSHTKYEATSLSRDIGYIEAEIMNKVDQFIKKIR